MAQTAMVLHGLKVDEWEQGGLSAVDEYIQFLKKRRDKCLRAHWTWRTLLPVVISQIDTYLPNQESIDDIVCKEQVFTIHGDMTDENVIGVEVEGNQKKTKKGPKYVFLSFAFLFR